MVRWNNCWKSFNRQKEVRSVTGSLLVLEAFLAVRCWYHFWLPGRGDHAPIYDALYDYQEKLKHILVRHEQGGIHAAQGYARTSGKTANVFATSGRVLANYLVTGLADAMIDSTPLVCVTGQVFAHLWYWCFHRKLTWSITTPVTKWNYQLQMQPKFLPC